MSLVHYAAQPTNQRISVKTSRLLSISELEANVWSRLDNN